MKVRIQKFLSEKGYCSRRQAEEFIRAERIQINGATARLGDHVEEGDKISVDGKVLDLPTPERVILLWHKPKGIETTLAPAREGEKTLADIDFGTRVFPIGRLDKDSRGLLLLTNDGELGNRLAHPRYEHEKEYEVMVDKSLINVALHQMEEGVQIGDKKKTAPCRVQKLGDRKFSIVLHEGRNRQIRRMCEVLGYQVKDLFRVRFSSLLLGDVKPGEWRRLNSEEERKLRESALKPLEK